METIFSHPIIETKTGTESGGVEATAPAFSLLASIAPPAFKAEQETPPARRLGTFLSSRFFGGRDRQPVIQVDERPVFVQDLPKNGAMIPDQNGEAPIDFEAGRSGENLVPLVLPALVPATPPVWVAETLDSVAQEPSAQLPTATSEAVKSIAFAIAEPISDALTPVASSETPASPEAASAPRITLPNSFNHSQPRPIMTPTETAHAPTDGRATAQLTLPFEITSLQLTPSFKLGSVQLKALSNVVSLHLVAAQPAENPLAAGISFQIEHVDLDGASRIKSLLLKPLGESRELAAPRSNMEIRNVEVIHGSGVAPISVTTSEQVTAAVQLLGTFVIAAMEFTPAFEIGSLKLEPTSNTVLVRVASSSRLTAQDLPPSFEIAEVNLGNGAQIAGARLISSTV